MSIESSQILVKKAVFIMDMLYTIFVLNNGISVLHTFMRYDRGAITLETSGLRARPYCAAPRHVAVSASEGRAITLILEPNCA